MPAGLRDPDSAARLADEAVEGTVVEVPFRVLVLAWLLVHDPVEVGEADVAVEVPVLRVRVARAVEVLEAAGNAAPVIAALVRTIPLVAALVRCVLVAALEAVSLVDAGTRATLRTGSLVAGSLLADALTG